MQWFPLTHAITPQKGHNLIARHDQIHFFQNERCIVTRRKIVDIQEDFIHRNHTCFSFFLNDRFHAEQSMFTRLAAEVDFDNFFVVSHRFEIAFFQHRTLV